MRGKEDYLTVSEVAVAVGRSVERIKQLHKEGKVPEPIRVQLSNPAWPIRAYSPRDVERIRRHLAKNGKPYRLICRTKNGKSARQQLDEARRELVMCRAHERDYWYRRCRYLMGRLGLHSADLEGGRVEPYE